MLEAESFGVELKVVALRNVLELEKAERVLEVVAL